MGNPGSGFDTAEELEACLRGDHIAKFNVASNNPEYCGDLFLIQSDQLLPIEFGYGQNDAHRYGPFAAKEAGDQGCQNWEVFHKFRLNAEAVPACSLYSSKNTELYWFGNKNLDSAVPIFH